MSFSATAWTLPLERSFPRSQIVSVPRLKQGESFQESFLASQAEAVCPGTGVPRASRACCAVWRPPLRPGEFWGPWHRRQSPRGRRAWLVHGRTWGQCSIFKTGAFGGQAGLCRAASSARSSLGAGWGRRQEFFKQVSQRGLKTGLRVAAMNQKKKCYFDLVTYWREDLFLPHRGKPDLRVCAHGAPEAQLCPGRVDRREQLHSARASASRG